MREGLHTGMILIGDRNGHMERMREEAKVLRDEREPMMVTAGALAMIGVLVALLTFFVTFAPGA